MTCFTTAEAMGIYSKSIFHQRTTPTARMALTVYKRRWRKGPPFLNITTLDRATCYLVSAIAGSNKVNVMKGYN
ncbi:hypothetical protein EB796_003792 [Bugula neritina]|uniref:Uncharacterized protein n=1 Tax=Bugula neritina TaxID=10212 RepID=A0A7J7KGV2_BUGNE|nr:hypothetical protein EB796_003792 [Bugula neritina]